MYKDQDFSPLQVLSIHTTASSFHIFIGFLCFRHMLLGPYVFLGLFIFLLFLCVVLCPILVCLFDWFFFRCLFVF